MGGLHNHNKVKGVSKDRYKRIVKSQTKRVATISMKRELTNKKRKLIEKAVRNRNKLLAKKGLIDYEEEMKDVAVINPGLQRVSHFCIPSDDVLAAAASGSGTTLGAPRL
ncbi:hypothetical protein BDB01DRAFT_839059 [Pilobolus umbonatus]|nr:hypothetical protein BDB01DRAFT_839059 [Pilobolus umbonatus]